MFTGLYPISHGVLWNGMRLSPDHLTLAEVLGAAGYQTAAFVSSFALDETWGYRQGFAVYADDFDPASSSVQESEWNGVKLEGGFDRRANRTAARAIEWLETDWDRTRPFFLFVHYFDPHAPYAPPVSMRGRIRADSSDPIDLMIAAYDTEILFADQALGRLMDELAKLDIDSDTLVVVTADHGEGLMQHGHMEHGVHLYEEAVRVPLVFRWKGRIEAGQVFSEPVELVDLTPTILELIGIRSEVDAQGRSLAGVLKGSELLDPLRPVFLHRRRYKPQTIGKLRVGGERWALRLGDWKFITANADEEAELYRLSIDPRERTNVIGYHADRVARMQARIDEWRRAGLRHVISSDELSDEERARLEVLGYVE
jgi:arylsulfatase A-like enzyme